MALYTFVPFDPIEVGTNNFSVGQEALRDPKLIYITHVTVLLLFFNPHGQRQ